MKKSYLMHFRKKHTVLFSFLFNVCDEFVIFADQGNHSQIEHMKERYKTEVNNKKEEFFFEYFVNFLLYYVRMVIIGF